ncbi:MAG: type IV pili twitching motility protein PilT, partial [Candidatus Levybacteria bacterium CG10_big_fil_rev_8_21_14_0_10_36_30]
MTIQELFEKSIENKASELHLISGSSPIIRIDGRLSPLATFPILTNLDIENLVKPIMSAAQQQLFSANRSIDFSYAYGGGDYGEKGRFRINLYYQRNTVAGAFRLLPPAIRTIEELLLPRICHKFSGLKQGFILVTGPTGHGKSTTIASIVNEINMNQAANIITIEDPIEYIYG